MFRILTACLFLISYGPQAQTLWEFNDEKPFVLKVNGHTINSYPCSILAFELNEKKCTVQTKMDNTEEWSQVLTPKMSTQQRFQLNTVKGVVKWVLVEESPWTGQGYSENSNTGLAEMYRGSVGCEGPMGPASWEEYKSKWNTQPFDLKKIEWFNLHVDNTCFTAEQVSELLKQLELEDDKLWLMQKVKGHVFNWDHRSSWLETLHTERSQSKAKLILDL